jgi:glycosyltransferase involved in cell wall biosynthesis
MRSITLTTVYVRKPRIVAGDCGGCSRAPRPKAELRATLITPTLGLGGAEQWVRTLVTYTDPAKIAWTVAVLNPNSWSPLIAEPVRRHADVLTIGREYRTKPEMLREALREADVVVTWGGGDYWPLATQAPIVMVAHGSCQWTRDAVAKAIAGGAALVVGVSEKASEAVRDLCGNVPVTTIWNGVDPARLQVTRNAEDIRTNVWKVPQHWFAHQRRYVGYVGRLSPEKNVESVIEAVAQLPSYYYCVLIGDSGEARERILTLGRQRLGERLIAVPSVDDVGNHLAALDCLVQASQREGNSLTLMEAMYVGVPIVTTRVGAVEEVERAAGERLFWSVPDDPTAQEIATGVREAVTAEFQFAQTRNAAEFAHTRLPGQQMATIWSDLLRQSKICGW